MVGEWRLIETAPKDGSRFLGTDGDKVAGSYWKDSHDTWADETAPTDDGEGCTFHSEWFGITHWMPLPVPPSPTNPLP